MQTPQTARDYLTTLASEPLTPADFTAYSPAYRMLGVLATRNSWETYSQPQSQLYGQHFTDTDNPWATQEGQRLAEHLYGKTLAARLPAAWDILLTLPYDTGYAARPYRSANPARYRKRRLDFLQNAYAGAREGYGQLNVTDIARYGIYQSHVSGSLAPFLAAELAAEGAGGPLFRTLSDIINGDDDIGGVCALVLQPLLTSPRREGWEVVGRLMLAAQRQEGLRQAILERFGAMAAGAMVYFAGLIVEHGLVRFSSVVRAVDTWFGFGWQAPRARVVNQVLIAAQACLSSPAERDAHLQSKDHLERYAALWATAMTESETAFQLAVTQLQEGKPDVQLLAAHFVWGTGLTSATFQTFVVEQAGRNQELDFYLSRHPGLSGDPRLLDAYLAYGRELGAGYKVFPPTLFSWLTPRVTGAEWYRKAFRLAEPEDLIRIAENLTDLPSEARDALMRRLFPDAFKWGYGDRRQNHKKRPTPDAATLKWLRPLVHRAIPDRSHSVHLTGLNLLRDIPFNDADIALVTDLLRRKGKAFRKDLIEVILTQEDAVVQTVSEQLLTAKTLPQRSAGLEILATAYADDRLVAYALPRTEAYREAHSVLTETEHLLLSRFAETGLDLTRANGFGTIVEAQLTPPYVPQPQFDDPRSADFLFADFIDGSKIKTAVDALGALVDTHGKHEYEIVSRSGEREGRLIMNSIEFTRPRRAGETATDYLTTLPLAEVWLGWYQNAGLNEFELLLALHHLRNANHVTDDHDPLQLHLRRYFPVIDALREDTPPHDWNRNRTLADLVNHLFLAHADLGMILRFCIDVHEDCLATLPDTHRRVHVKTNQWGWKEERHWVDTLNVLRFSVPWNTFNAGILTLAPNDQLRYWHLQNYMMTARNGDYPRGTTPVTLLRTIDAELAKRPTDANLTLQLHATGKITDTDLRVQLLLNDGLLRDIDQSLLDDGPLAGITHARAQQIWQPIKAALLKIELERGDLPTDATLYLGRLHAIHGFHYVLTATGRLGQDSLFRGYQYGQEKTKRAALSAILKITRPAEHDTVEEFTRLAKASEITTDRWVDVAMYAPQWAPWIAHVLDVEELESAVWFFHAHAVQYHSKEQEAIIARYTPVNVQDLRRGALDVDWFEYVYRAVGKKTWKLLHAAAKYVSDGNGHRQVTLYSSIRLKEVKITETIKKIKEKRDKTSIRGLGLIPLSRANPRGDLIRRYKLLQEFRREGKQFGAQRRESEEDAVRIGLANLARNAGFEDLTRFQWIMEGQATVDLLEEGYFESDNVVVELNIDELGRAEIEVVKNGKPQKTIPAKLRKHPKIKRLKEVKTELRRQYQRTRHSLERAMTSGLRMTTAELAEIFIHPVVHPMLAKLVLHFPERGLLGFITEEGLRDVEGKLHAVEEEDEVVIAHPVQLYHDVEWDRFQRYAFEHGVVQPFKQIFRELYVPTQDERTRNQGSNRYQGYQIQTKKTIALLRSRGWTLNHDEGLQKIFHGKNVIATLYAMADWYSPAEVEAPTLEEVVFLDRRTYKPIPLSELDPILFSEVMRDVDLVVAVAHAGAVDPEVSHGTLAMRAALARESARLFKLDNVKVKDHFLIIEGQLGVYSIHLGSGMVSKRGLQLGIIPVQSQHRGRVFLPFVDEDPKAAEIISKMKLLAEDSKIRDPSVLQWLTA